MFKKMNFEELVAVTIEKLKEEQEKFNAKYKIADYDSWYYDQPSGVFTFSNGENKLYFAFQTMGTLSRKSNTWLWSWANKNTYPKVKAASFKVKEFGLKNDYEKLVNPKWDAEEVDCWEMLSIAYKLLKPLGVYRINSDETLMFIVFTKELTIDQVKKLEANSPQLVECNCHGVGRMAFVCEHLNTVELKGFNESFETEKDMKLNDEDEFQAWCDECEKIRVKYDGWNEKSEKFANIKLVCEDCYFEMKECNQNL